MSRTFSFVIMWLAWWFAAFDSVLMAHYCISGGHGLNTFARPIGIYEAGMFLQPILFCGALRFWLSRIRHPWLALIPFFSGVFFAFVTGSYGIYLFPEFCIAFQILSGVLMALYVPLFVRLQAGPPPLPVTAKA